MRLSGAIASGGGPFRQNLSLASCAQLLDRAFEMKEAPAVALIVNSPGGSPAQSRLIYRRIRDLAEEKNKKVHVFVEDVAASGGYMIAVAGDDITVDPSSIVGSIGVIAAGFGFTGAIEKLGIERRVYTAGSNKSVLDPFSPEKESDIEHLKSLQREIHQTFIDLVKEARGDKLVDHPDLFTGQFWTGTTALEMGLVDAIGDIRATLKAKYGAKTKLSLVEPKRGLLGRRAQGVAVETLGAQLGHQIADGALSAVEERALWARYGL